MPQISGQWCGKSPLAQVDQFHDLVTSRRLSGVSTSEPGDRTAIFLNCILQKPRIIAEYSVIVRENLVWLETTLVLIMTIFFYTVIVNIKLLVLPPHELNRWEDLFCHHTELTAGRILTSVHNSNTYQPPLKTGLDDSWSMMISPLVLKIYWRKLTSSFTESESGQLREHPPRNMMAKQCLHSCKPMYCWLGKW